MANGKQYQVLHTTFEPRVGYRMRINLDLYTSRKSGRSSFTFGTCVHLATKTRFAGNYFMCENQYFNIRDSPSGLP